MSKENDFLELLQCEDTSFLERATKLKSEWEKYLQDSSADLKVSTEEKDHRSLEIRKESDETKALKSKRIENQDLYKSLLDNGLKLKSKHDSMKSENDRLSNEITKQAAKFEKEKSSIEAQKERIENKRLVIKTSFELYQKFLGLEILVLKGNRMQFVFRNLNPLKPDTIAFIIISLNDMVYAITESYPMLGNLKAIEDTLNKTNNLGGFIQYTRSLLKNKMAEW